MTSESTTARVTLSHLDELWFQVTGTRCNLTCNHCFISCSPHNNSFGFLSRTEIQKSLEESKQLGVKGYYFTGGEPFLHPEMVEILEDTLKIGPATVLTNATVLKDEWLQRLQQAQSESRYSLEFRVSIDGFDAETNDPIRGEGTFARAIRGVKKLVNTGFLPIITATRTWKDSEDSSMLSGFISTLKQRGYSQPRIKLLPTLKLGAEQNRSGGYTDQQRVTGEMLQDYDRSQLVCEHSRIVTTRGVHVCPILIESPDALLSNDLATAAQKSYTLSHGACFTCYQYGAICSNISTGSGPGGASS